MIQRIRGNHDRVFCDTTLYGLVVPSIDANCTYSEALTWLVGVSQANDLKLSYQEDLVLLQANDIAKVSILDSDISEETLENLKKLKWDLLPHRGQYIVEYPIGHDDIFQELKRLPNEPVQLQITIATMGNAQLLSKGISMEEYIDANINFFDFFTNKDGTKWDNINAGFRVNLQREDVQDIFDQSTTLLSSSILGKVTTNALVTSVPYETYQRDPDGFVTQRSVQFIEAGLNIQTITTKYQDNYLVDFSIEFSDITPGKDLPIVSKRLSTCSLVMSKDKPALVSTLLVRSLSDSARRGLFGTTKTNKQQQTDQLQIFAKLL